MEGRNCLVNKYIQSTTMPICTLSYYIQPLSMVTGTKKAASDVTFSLSLENPSPLSSSPLGNENLNEKYARDFQIE